MVVLILTMYSNMIEKKEKYNVAVVGATGNVGRCMLDILYERNFPINKIFAIASDRSAGKEIFIRGNKIIIHGILNFPIQDIDIALFSAGSEISKAFANKFADSGSYIIDNSSYFRMDENIPLVVSEVNPGDIKKYNSKIIANPNCSTMQAMVALKPIHDHFAIKRIVYNTYQSTSGAGKEKMESLLKESIHITSSDEKYHAPFIEACHLDGKNKQIAFNVVPHIDVFMEDGSTKEEWKMKVETQKILSPNIKVHANCARVPSFIGHAEYINIETERKFEIEDVKRILSSAHGLKVVDCDNTYATPIDVHGKDDVFISRIRKDDSVENGLSIWCVADNLRKGAALNAIQIAEILIK
jgi:aspartate-semialdehyde dehydrogenase